MLKLLLLLSSAQLLVTLITKFLLFIPKHWDFPDVQWLRLCASNLVGVGSVPGWEVRFPHAVWPKGTTKSPQIKLMHQKSYSHFDLFCTSTSTEKLHIYLYSEGEGFTTSFFCRILFQIFEDLHSFLVFQFNKTSVVIENWE